MTFKGKKEAVMIMNKEKYAEDCCFVCKDGGALLICDYKDCLKCFHPFCVGKEDSILESDGKWVCDRHSCFCCSRSSTYLYCYTCTKSVCRHCHPAVDFFQIKGKYGFCEFCLKVVLLIEEKKDYDSDGEKVDFTDNQTVEFYFVEYYHVIKDKEGFELKDLYAAVERAKIRKECQSESDSEEDEEEEEYTISDYDGTDDESRLHWENRSKRMKSAIKSKKKKFKLEGEDSEEIRSQGTKNGQRASKTNVIELLDEEEEYTITDYGGTEDESRLHSENRSKRMKSAVKSKKKETCSQEMKNGQRASKTNVIELLDEEEAYTISDYGGAEDESRLHSENRSKRMKSAVKSNKKEVKLKGEESEEIRSQETKNGQRASKTNVIELLDEEEEYTISDYGGTEDESRLHSENRSKRIKSAIKSNKKEIRLEGEESEEIRSQETKNGQRASKTNVIELLDVEEEYTISDYGGTEDESENRSKRMKSAIQSNKKEIKLGGVESEEIRSQETKNGQRASKTNVIELLDSVNRAKFDDVEIDRWCIRGPYGDHRDKCSLSLLRKWSERSPYASNFKVWRDDENEENAIWLLEALSFAFPKKSKEDA